VPTTTTTALLIPSPPGNLKATAISSSRIDLGWTDNSTNETGFKIERALSSSGPFSQIATVGTNVTFYSNTGLNPNTFYHYRVRAYNAAGDSAYSNIAKDKTLR
jgi:titin